MIKRLFFCFFLILIKINLLAWERHSDTTFLISFKGGITKSNVIGFDVKSEDYFGQNYELLFTFHINQEFSLHSGLGFIQKGFINDIEHKNWRGESIGFHATTYRFNYLYLPFTFQYNLGRKKINVYLTAGLNFNYLQNQKTFADLPELVDDVEIEPFEEDFTDFYKNTAIGYHAGIGIEYKIYPALSIFIDTKYYKDFSNIYPENVSGNLKHQTYSLNLGIKIGIPIKYNVYYKYQR